MRKRQRPRVARPEALEHRQERRAARRRQPAERFAHRLVGVERHGELVLDEARAPVDPVPLEHAVERMEEVRDALVAGVPARGLAKPDLVERPHGARAQQPLRHPGRRGELRRGSRTRVAPCAAWPAARRRVAKSPRVSTARPIARRWSASRSRPPSSGTRRRARTSASMQSSRLSARSVSTRRYADSIRRSRTVAASTIPVSPMPPAVAQKAPAAVGGSSGRSTRVSPGRRAAA